MQQLAFLILMVFRKKETSRELATCNISKNIWLSVSLPMEITSITIKIKSWKLTGYILIILPLLVDPIRDFTGTISTQFFLSKIRFYFKLEIIVAIWKIMSVNLIYVQYRSTG